MPSTTITDIVLDQWIDLGANRCRSISATALSEGPEPPPPDEDDMPLHSAVYEPSRDFIYAVRGGTVFKMNATTGKKISSFRYGAGADLSDTYIDYDSGRDKLWVTYSTSFRAPAGVAHPTNDMYIYKLNVDTFAIEQTIGIGANNLDIGTQAFLQNNVIRHLRSNGIQLACWMGVANLSNGAGFFVFDPDTLPGNIFSKNGLDGSGARWGFIDIYPSSTDYLLCTDQNYNNGVMRFTDANVLVEQSETYPNNGFNTAAPITARIYGFAFNAGNNMHYCANRSNLILRLDASNNPNVGTAIDTGRASADIWNVRRNPHNGKIYAPTFSDNAVAIIDPNAGDALTIKTGFDSPWDVVFTPTKSWAVQQSSEGLREIV